MIFVRSVFGFITTCSKLYELIELSIFYIVWFFSWSHIALTVDASALITNSMLVYLFYKRFSFCLMLFFHNEDKCLVIFQFGLYLNVSETWYICLINKHCTNFFTGYHLHRLRVCFIKELSLEGKFSYFRMGEFCIVFVHTDLKAMLKSLCSAKMKPFHFQSYSANDSSCQ